MPRVLTALSLLVLCASLTGLSDAATTAEPATAAPPRSVRIEDLRVRLERGAGQVAGSAARSVVLSGAVAGQRDTLVALLNALHAVHFFALPGQMTLQTSVVLQEDGTVQTQWLHRSDEPTTRVCVSVSTAYEKCVTFTATAGPADLVQLADQTFARALKP
jgi:hypothetical protein